MKHGFLEILLLAQHKTDPNLVLHAKRVACYASELATILGHQDKFKKLFIAGLLHDLGFLSLDIQFREGDLGLTQEQTIMEFHNHGIESERLLSPLISDKELLSAIRHHHEKYNGEGFPDQLEGENIPLCARILAVADLYDALLIGKLFGEKRITPKDAIEQMTTNKDISLDPIIVEAFIKLLEKNPVLLQPKGHNALAVYKMIFLEPGNLEQGDLINQDGTILVKQGYVLDEKTLEKIRFDFPGQKLIKPEIKQAEAETENNTVT
ncbi:MAG: HD-GYP domain-containing protein [Methylococcaceae bacterium]